MNKKTIIEFVRLWYHLKNYGDLGWCNNTLLDLHNSLDDTQPHSIIDNYYSFKIFLGF